jgi:transposase-like protein
VARKERGEGIKRIAGELGIDRKTVKRWLRLGSLAAEDHQSGIALSRGAERRHP